MAATPTITSNETITNGLNYIARIEFRHEPNKAFQNVSAYPSRWTFEVPENSWIQLKYPIPLSAKGCYIVPSSEPYNGVITIWEVQASNDRIVFDNVVPPNTTRLKKATLHNFT